METGKQGWRTAVLAIACACACGGCFLDRFFLEKHPICYPDWNERYGVLDFREGDRFELLRNMNLWNSMDKDKFDDMGGTLEKWGLTDLDPPNGYPVVRVVPAGETMEIIAIKREPYQNTLLVYCRLEGGEKWVIDFSFDTYKGEGHYTYNRKDYRRVSEGPETPSGRDSSKVVPSPKAIEQADKHWEEMRLLEASLTKALEEFHRTNGACSPTNKQVPSP